MAKKPPMRKFAVVPELFRAEGISFVEFEFDEATGGFRTHYLSDFKAPPIKEDWFLNLEDLVKTMEIDFGIKPSTWKNS